MWREIREYVEAENHVGSLSLVLRGEAETAPRRLRMSICLG